MTTSEWISLAGLVVTTAGIGGLAFYCAETWKIRTAAERQLEAQRTPCVTFAATPRDANEAILEMHDARGTMILNFDAGDAILYNVGNGTAVNIEYVLTSPAHPQLDGYVPFLPAGGRATIPVSRNSLQGLTWNCSIQYDSLSFTRYETKVAVRSLVLVPPFEFGRVKPKKG